MTTPWYMKGETGEYLRDWAEFLVHGDSADWWGLAKKAQGAGLNDSEVNEFLQSQQDDVDSIESYYGLL